MKKLLYKLILGCIFMSFNHGLSAQDYLNKIDIAINKRGNQSIVIMLDNEIDLRLASSYKSKDARANYVYHQLYQKAKTSQHELIEFLNSINKNYQKFYIVNMIATKADYTLMREIAKLESVKSILLDGHFELEKPERETRNSRSIEWGLTKIKAPEVWALGYTGQGVVIGGQDTGYDWEHPAIKDKYRGWDGVTPNHDYNWHDAIHNSSGNPCGNDSTVPCDDNSHGTHTMGTMVGDDGAGHQIGVAPGSKWIACRNMDEGYGTLSTYVECFEWFLAPYPIGQTPAQGNPSKSPHVINNSWGCPAVEGCNQSNFYIMETALNNLRNAGTVIVVSNGNSGSSCSSTYSPAAFYQNSFSVGATNSSDQIASFSSRGPILHDSSNRLKPNVSAPGVSILSCIPGGGYSSKSGTSMAGPHVAGTVALMISANPQLAGRVEEIENILEQTAIPISTNQICGTLTENDIPNNTFGYGRIDALAAVNRANDTQYIPFIKVDQFGYLPNASKIAIISDPQIGFNSSNSFTPPATIHLKDAITHISVFSSNPISWQSGMVDTLSGDKAWWFDFSNYTTPGTYYVSTNGERSEDFVIDEHVYDDALEAAFKTFYYQRCGVVKEAPYSLPGYTDPVCHTKDLTCKYIIDPSQTKDLSGGWHDAGDHSKYVNYTYTTLINLLFAYEYNPEAWNDDMNIPESENGIPDILDEIKFELDWLLKMQDTDGGVYSIVGTQNYASASPPSDDTADRFYGPKTTSATLSTAATMAFAARQFRKINIPSAQAYSSLLESKSELAFKWADINPDITYNNLDDIIASSNQEIDTYERDMRKLSAAIYLYALTQKNTYKNYIETHYDSAHLIQWYYAYPFETSTQQALMLYAHLPNVSSSVSNDIISKYKTSIENSNENLPAANNNSDAYRSYISEQDITWGSNSIKCEKGNIYQPYYHYNINTTNDSLVRVTMDDFIHYIHGNNPMGLCYLTNMSNMGAERSCNTIYHEWFTDESQLWDDNRISTYGPPPGYLPGGPNPNWSLDDCCPSECGSENADCITLNPPSGQPALKSYYEWNAGWPQNSWEITENAIYYQAAYLLSLSNRVNTSPELSDTFRVVKFKDVDLDLTAPQNSFILKSEGNIMYKLNIDNQGYLSTMIVNSLSNLYSSVKNASLYIEDRQKGILLNSPDNTTWRLSIDPAGNLITSQIGVIPNPIIQQPVGDFLIEKYDNGIILKDKDGICYIINVTDTGQLFQSVIRCSD